MAFWNRKKSEAEQSLEALQSGAGPQAAPSEPTGPFSMTIEDVFSITGRGTVVTGRVSSGVVRVGMTVHVAHEPTPVTTTVTAVEMFRKRTDSAQAGDNVGLLLDGVGKDDVSPGDEVSAG